MSPTRLLAASLITLATAAVAFSCGGSDSREIKDVNAIYDNIPFYPGAELDGAPALPPGLGRAEHRDDFKNDRRFFIYGPNASQRSVLDYFDAELPKVGWQVEDPVTSHVREMRDLCPDASATDATAGTPRDGLVGCRGFLKDDVRLILSVAFPLQLNPVSAQGVSYHIHLEAR